MNEAVTITGPGIEITLSKPYDIEQFESAVAKITDIKEVKSVKQVEEITRNPYAESWSGIWEINLSKYAYEGEVREVIVGHIIDPKKTPDLSAYCHRLNNTTIRVSIEQIGNVKI